MDVRHRQVKTDDDWSPSPELAKRPKKVQSNFGQKPIIILTLLGILFLGYLLIANDLKTSKFSVSIDNLASSFNLQKPFYACVIDAGSTGTRILAFTFHTSLINGELILDNELYSDTKPGLSSYADNPKDALIGLKKLLDKAKTVIPKSEWSKTPLTMKATAGLRLLPIEKANALLDECRKFFNDSGFLVDNESVEIMDGVDEGIFGWFTVNFLLNHLTPNNYKNTVAVLDLGGGSTQVTYSPDADDEISDLELDHIHTISALKNNMSIYTHSHLGMGLMAARKAILTSNVKIDGGKSEEIIEVHSECVNPIIDNKEWSYGGKKFLVKGPINGAYKVVKGRDGNVPIVRFEECVKAVKKHTDSIKERPVGLGKHDVYLVSYYFDRAAEAGLIHPFEGGVISLERFYKATLDACSDPNVDQPFACLDMTFIYVLLQDCFGLDHSTNLNLYKKYDGHELSWALGAAFSILQNDF